MNMPKSDAPGFDKRTLSDGSFVYYWIARRASRFAINYPIKNVRLKCDEETAKARCRVLSEELRVWLAAQAEAPMPAFDGTITSLINNYLTDPDSPFAGVRANTQTSYLADLKIIKRTVGARRVASLTRRDFSAWHRNFALPKNGGPPRARRARGLMVMLRAIIGYGVTMRFAGCRDARDVLSEMQFPQSERRIQALTVAQAEAIIDKALELGLRSIALGQALQFELGLRQIDVIGQWNKNDGGGGIAYGDRKWSGGITWTELTSGRLAKRTSKTGQMGEWNPAAYPLILKAMAAFPEAERIGPAIINEPTGQPYKDRRYGHVWRKVANKAGIPREVWNMDSRAGAISEANDAGANIEDMRQFATHANAQTTQRYIRRTGASTDRVAELRIKHRRKDDG